MTRRRWWLAGLAAVLLLLRAVLPEVVRRVSETQASETFGARVEIDDVDLGLLRGVVALDGVRVRPAAAAAEAAPPQPNQDRDQPVISWERFGVNLRWLSLPGKTVRLSSVELRDPRIAVDRLADGAINLMALVPPSDEGEADESDADAKPWGFAVDRLELDGGRLRFRDYAVRELETIEIGLPTLVVRDVALAPGHYRGPARTGVDVRVDEGRLRASTRLWLRDDGLAMATTLRARRLPLRRMRLYVPDVGWRELEGELGASVVHRLDTGRVHRVHGTATLDGVEVHVPDVPEPALTWKHLAIALASLDLNARRAVVDDVTLAGATLIVRPRDPAPLPVLSAGGAAAAATSPQQPPAAEPATPPAAPDEPSAEPFRWSVS